MSFTVRWHNIYVKKYVWKEQSHVSGVHIVISAQAWRKFQKGLFPVKGGKSSRWLESFYWQIVKIQAFSIISELWSPYTCYSLLYAWWSYLCSFIIMDVDWNDHHK